MFVLPLKMDGLVLIEPRQFADERGFFLETYRAPLYMSSGIGASFVQDNLSFSKQGVIRGLHYQKGQAKLVSVLQGKIWDVAVDLRIGSPTFGQWEAVELDDRLRRQFYVPDGFAHGFAVLSETALVQYKVSAVYQPEEEKSLRWNDPDLSINWPIDQPILSERDRNTPFFREVLCR